MERDGYRSLPTWPEEPEAEYELDRDADEILIRRNSHSFSAIPPTRERPLVRLIICTISLVLLFLFLLALSEHGRPTQPQLLAASSSVETRSVWLANDISVSPMASNGTRKLDDYEANERPARPVYSNYMMSVLDGEQSARRESTNSRLLDDLSLSHLGDNVTAWWRVDTRDSGNYATISNYIRATKSFGENLSVTLTTQATTDFMYHALELCRRWDGPISVAVFCPGPDLSRAITLIKFMRQCLPLPLSACIADKITWHLVYPVLHGPHMGDIGPPARHLDQANYRAFIRHNTCPKMPGPGPGATIQQFELQLGQKSHWTPASYREQKQLPYPINVLRNVARLAADTRHVLCSDIELYPSVNMVPALVGYLQTKAKESLRDKTAKKFVIALPIFEVKSNVSEPKSKRELVEKLRRGDAIFFHKWVCDACQSFPNRQEWLDTDVHGRREFRAPDGELAIFEATQRDKTMDSWEPIFIGTNEEPLYDDRLTWDGRRDKMGQMYEMCLMDYHILVAGNLFLVHAPGIKHIDRKDVIKRLAYIKRNNAIYDATMSALKVKYRSSANINKC